MSLEVVLDTNILIFISDGKFNIQSEIERIFPQKHEIVILTACLKEMDYLIKKKPQMSRHKKFIEKFLPTIKLIDFDPENITETDKKIVAYAEKYTDSVIVATNDVELKNLLRNQNLPVIFVRTFNHLELVGFVK
ncbi:MAG: PIN domain-containing protein [Candidatus Heimdallarchaeota archaeon]|nr:PIN domain-containing protein [Candidatus Heimdallarchaeota archaeon]